MANKRILVLGAGLAGLSAAWHLQQKGADCRVFEKNPEVGGLCRSKIKNGFIFDCDGHLLHFRQKYALDLIKRRLKVNLVEHKRNAQVYFSGKYIHYPFQANLYGLPINIAKECLFGYIRAAGENKVKNRECANFHEWIIHNFGSGIAKHFMIPYNSKFWTVPPAKLTNAWLGGFVPVPSLSRLIEGSLRESKQELGYNARFWYPEKGGINQLAEAFAKQVSNINLDCPVIRISLKSKEIETHSGRKEKFDYLISTIPLPELPQLIKDMPGYARNLFKKLEWNSIFNLNLGIERGNFNGKHWVYFHQKEISFFRIGFFHNFSNDLVPPGKKSLYVELAYPRNKQLNRKKIIDKIISDLKKIGFISSKKDISTLDVNDIKYGYPVYNACYAEAQSGITNYLMRNNITPCGRYGSWRYFSMEDAILNGKEAAEAVLKND